MHTAWDELVGDVLGLARALGVERFDLVGHDWGGAIAWEVARRHPEKLRTLSVLNCPPGDVMARVLRSNWQQLKKSWYMLFFQLPKVPEWYFAQDPHKTIVGSLAAVAQNRSVFTADVVAPYVEQVRERGLPGINYYRAALGSLFDRRPPPVIELPTRLVWGLGDGALGPWFADEALYRRVATDLDVVRIEGAGHWVQQEAAPEVNRALQEHWALHP